MSPEPFSFQPKPLFRKWTDGQSLPAPRQGPGSRQSLALSRQTVGSVRARSLGATLGADADGRGRAKPQAPYLTPPRPAPDPSKPASTALFPGAKPAFPP